MSMPRWLLLIATCTLCGCSKSTSDLVTQMKADDPILRREAIHALQERVNETSEVVPALVSALQDPDIYVRRDAARALGQLGASAASDAVTPLLGALRDKEVSMRKAAAAALKKVDPAAAARAGIR